MSIELRRLEILGDYSEDLDEVIARDAYVHLEMLSDTAVMLIIEDAHQHVHLRITHKGRSPIRVWELERLDKEAP